MQHLEEFLDAYIPVDLQRQIVEWFKGSELNPAAAIVVLGLTINVKARVLGKPMKHQDAVADLDRLDGLRRADVREFRRNPK